MKKPREGLLYTKIKRVNQYLGARGCVALDWRAAMQFVDECVGKEKPL